MIHARTKIIALIALLLFTLSLAVYGGVLYFVGKHKTTLYEERLRAAEAGVQARALNALEETVRTSLDDRKKLMSYILPKTSVIEFVTDIETIARSQGVTFTTNNLSEIPVDDTFEELEMSATIEGSFDGIMRMLRVLESIPMQSTLPEVSISRNGEGGLWTATVTIRVTTQAQL